MSEILEKCHESLIQYKSLLESEGETLEAETIYDLILQIETELEL